MHSRIFSVCMMLRIVFLEIPSIIFPPHFFTSFYIYMLLCIFVNDQWLIIEDLILYEFALKSKQPKLKVFKGRAKVKLLNTDMQVNIIKV